MSWYKNDRGSVAILDGTNTTAARRRLIIERAQQEQPELQLRPMFIEIICNDKQGTHDDDDNDRSVWSLGVGTRSHLLFYNHPSQ